MDVTQLTTIVSLLTVLSIASERLVEIVKGLWPWLNTENTDPTIEGRRRAALQGLAVLAGIATALLARSVIPQTVFDTTTIPAVLALGLLASGGSGFWNSILTYFAKVKDVKSLEAKLQQTVVDQAKVATGSGLFPDLRLGSEQVTSNECYDVEDA